MTFSGTLFDFFMLESSFEKLSGFKVHHVGSGMDLYMAYFLLLTRGPPRGRSPEQPLTRGPPGVAALKNPSVFRRASARGPRAEALGESAPPPPGRGPLRPGRRRGNSKSSSLQSIGALLGQSTLACQDARGREEVYGESSSSSSSPGGGGVHSARR